MTYNWRLYIHNLPVEYCSIYTSLSGMPLTSSFYRNLLQDTKASAKLVSIVSVPHAKILLIDLATARDSNLPARSEGRRTSCCWDSSGSCENITERLGIHICRKKLEFICIKLEIHTAAKSWYWWFLAEHENSRWMFYIHEQI